MAADSSYLDEAYELLDSVRGKPQTVKERKKHSLDLAALMLRAASRSMTPQEWMTKEQLARLISDPLGKAFTSAMVDSCFRSSDNHRVANQMIYLLNQFGVPKYLSWSKRLQLQLFRMLGPKFARHLVPFVTKKLQKESSQFILPAEMAPLTKKLEERRSKGMRINLVRLSETIQNEHEAKKSLQAYLDDLENPHIDHLSVRISNLFSQINLIDFSGTLDTLAERMRTLYRAAMQHPIVFADGDEQHRVITLEMEHYSHLYLTVALFQKVLDEPEFQHYTAGIVLQAYLPDSFEIQKELTEWAKKRVAGGGAPIYLRIVKGSYLCLEQVEASMRNLPLAPYLSKLESDANFKRMIQYCCIPEHARAVHIGIGNHNLFDLSYAMLLRMENQVEPYVMFEMMEGMVDPIRRVVHKLTGDMLLYCPIASKSDFLHAVGYLFRRLDENSGPENSLRYIFNLKPGTSTWENQYELFSNSCDEIPHVSSEPRRNQSRPVLTDHSLPFDNEPNTDFSIPAQHEWALQIVKKWRSMLLPNIPLVIGGEIRMKNEEGVRLDPSQPEKTLYRFALATPQDLAEALAVAHKKEREWQSSSVASRSELLGKIANKLREKRGDLIGAMMIDGSKIIPEADAEVSQAIDYAEYYRHQYEKMNHIPDIRWEAKGTILVVSPWNFPCSIPMNGILAALATGNCVILKPSSYAVLVAWHLVQAMWEAGVPKEVLQFTPCSREMASRHLIPDSRIKCVTFTGSTLAAHQMLQTRFDLDLAGETSGKNAMIITAMADRETAIRALVTSAFGHNGQKCSATSLAILESEVYYDPLFRHQLKEAVRSLKVGPAWDLSTRISPLILPPSGDLLRGLTTLEENEEWLLEPQPDPANPHLWSPGIKLGVQPNSFTHQTELFGPVLGLMCAGSLTKAIELANGTPYGLCAGLMTLDEREQTKWLEQIEAGNCFINRDMTHTMVRRQPFGGIKASSFGNGSKTGGPNYLREFMVAHPVSLPQEKHPVNHFVNNLTVYLNKINLTAEELGTWYASVANYAYWWKRLKQNRDPNKIVGQDNFYRYVPRKNIVLRIGPDSELLDTLRVCAAALTVGAGLEISTPPHLKMDLAILRVVEETDEEFLQRIRMSSIDRIRMVEPAPSALKQAAASAHTHIIDAEVLANGRLELLHYLREISISIDYHRYGNLGIREGELRKPIA